MSLISINRDASTVEITGRLFPAATLICPQDPPDVEPRSELSRALGTGGGDHSVYIPAENGLLFRVEESRNERHHGLSLDLDARTCELVWSVDEYLYLPWSVGYFDGRFVAGTTNCWMWAEPGWVVETIDRLSVKPFTQPEGPLAQLVPLSHFERRGTPDNC